MKILLSTLFLAGTCSFATAGEERSIVTEPAPVPVPAAVVPPTTSPKVYMVEPPTCQPAAVVRQQTVVMEPQITTVEVERQITEYVPQVRTEVVEQQVTTMVPRVVQQQRVIQQRVIQQQRTCCQSGYSGSELGQRSVQRTYIRPAMTDKQLAVLYAQRAINVMVERKDRPGEIRRAKRRLAWLMHQLRDELNHTY